MWDAETVDPQEVHETLVALARGDASRDEARGRWLLKGLTSRVWLRVGMGSFYEYVERLWGKGPRWTEERLRVARALEELPKLRKALAGGKLVFSVVKEVTRVVTPETEAKWMTRIEGKTAFEVQQMVSGRNRGDDPDDPKDPRARRHRLRYEVNAETKAMLDAARIEAVRMVGHSLSDDELLQVILGTFLERNDGADKDETSADAGRCRTTVHMTVCEHCATGTTRMAGQDVPIRAEVVEAALCDAVVIPSDEEGEGPAEPPRGGTRRARQTVTPATRRKVMHRDKGSCSVPGCRNRAHVDVHHIKFQSEGGTHTQDNLTTLCGVHHGAVHDGRLIIHGKPGVDLKFFHADGSTYGAPEPGEDGGMLSVEAQKAEMFSRAYTILRDRGYRHEYIERALDELRPSVNPCAGPGGTARMAECWLSEQAARGEIDVVEIYDLVRSSA